MRALALAALVGCSQQTVAPIEDDLTVAILSHRDGDVVAAGVPLTFRGLAQAAESPSAAISLAWFTGELAQCLGQPDVDGFTECTLAVPAGEDTVTLRAQLASGLEQSASVVLDVQAAAGVPQVAIDAPTSADRYVAGQPILFEGHVADADDAPAELVVSWTSAIDGALALPGTPDGNGRVAGATSLSAGVHLVTLRAEDPDGNVGTDDVLVTVNPGEGENRLPTAPVVGITPGVPADEDPLVASILSPSADADGDPITYTWAWFREGQLQAGLVGTTVPASATAPGQTWRVTATPFDGEGYGPAGADEVVVDGEVDTDTDTDTGPGPFDYAGCGRSAVVERVIHSAGAADFRRVVYAPDGSYALVLQEWDDVWRFDPEDESLTRVAELTGATLYELAFDRTGAYALIGGSTASSTAPELRLWRYTPERGVERIVPPAFQSGGPPTSARRVTAFDQRADGTWAVLSDSYGTTQTPGNLLYLNELVIDDVSDGAWTYRAGVNSGATASWAPDTVGWAKNLGQDVVLTSTAQGTTHVWDAVNGWITTSHPGKGNLGEVMVDPVGREVAWVLNGFTAKVYTWEGTVLRDGTGESYSMAPTGIGIWRMGRSPDGAWKVFVGSAGKLWFTDSAWRPLDSARFYNATIPNFSQPPWSGGSGDGLADVAWRPGTCEGLVVGSEAQGQAILGWWSLQ